MAISEDALLVMRFLNNMAIAIWGIIFMIFAIFCCRAVLRVTPQQGSRAEPETGNGQSNNEADNDIELGSSGEDARQDQHTGDGATGEQIGSLEEEKRNVRPGRAVPRPSYASVKPMLDNVGKQYTTCDTIWKLRWTHVRKHSTPVPTP